MLSIADFASTSGVPGLGTDFLVAAVNLIDNQSLTVWFTRPVSNGATATNYTISGPSTLSVALAQYQTNTKAVNLYFSAPLVAGQWTISFSHNLVSNDPDALYLPTNTQVVFDLVDLSPQGTLGTNLVEGPVSKFIPKEFRNKTVWSAIVAAIETGDDLVATQARLAFDQYFMSSASGEYLNKRAGDKGVDRPENLGISDNVFRGLAISLVNNKLTNDAFLSILETMYGSDAIRGCVESAVPGPFEIFDQADLDILFDGQYVFHFVANWVDYQNPLQAQPEEVVAALNFALDKQGINAYAIVTNTNTIKIYSNTKGVRSSVTITGGTLQPYLQFDTPIYGLYSSTDDILQQQWTITNPIPGTVRLTPNMAVYWFPIFYLRVGDYVTIIGSNFPTGLRGSWPITNIVTSWNSTYSNVVGYVDIQCNYVVT